VFDASGERVLSFDPRDEANSVKIGSGEIVVVARPRRSD
jgi:hypothetical protein